MWLLYQVAFLFLTLISAPFLLATRGSHYLPTLRGRLAVDRGQRPEGWSTQSRPLWIHAVSVGEVGVADALSRGLEAQASLLVTTVTPTGQERARAIFRERAWVRYLPLDLGWPVRRFLEDSRPGALILIEGEFWPLLLHTLSRRRIPVVLVNGRISDRTFRRQLRLARLFGPSLLRPLYSSLLGLGVQSEDDRRRLVELGVEEKRVVVTGNLKYESPAPQRHEELEARLSSIAAIGGGEGRAVLVAGSTMAGEEEQVLEAFRRLGTDRALLLLAPRHPERFDDVARLIEGRGFALLRRSELDSLGDGAASSSVDVVLLDTLGELAGLYAMASAAFVGGTLVPTGGHNPLEPARYGTPVVVGPSMENFREMAQHFDRAQAWHRVADAAELAECFDRLLSQPEQAGAVGARGRQLIEDNRGAADRTRDLLSSLGFEQFANRSPATEPEPAPAESQQ